MSEVPSPTLDLSNFNVVIALLGGFLSTFGLVSYLLKEHFYLSEARKYLCRTSGYINTDPFGSYCTYFRGPLLSRGKLHQTLGVCPGIRVEPRSNHP